MLISGSIALIYRKLQGRKDRVLRKLAIVFGAMMLWTALAVAQQGPGAGEDAASASAEVSAAASSSPKAEEEDSLTVLPGHNWKRLWFWGQANLIEQGHPGFPAAYSGTRSFPSYGEHAMSRLFTFYTATRLTNRLDVVFDVEAASGLGIGNALGLAGYTNLDVVRIPGEGSPLSTSPYVARAIVRYVVPLGSEKEEVEANPLGALQKLPVRRLELRFGTFSMADFVDVNSVGSDSHLQFMNWTIDANGAWDYAANTRGYTWGLVADFHEKMWSLRFVEALMPKVANGIDMDWNLRRARAHNLELELRPQLLADRKTVVRLLGYRNVANMGNYAEAIRLFQNHGTAVPDVVATRQQGRTKNGAGLNAEQELTGSLRAFLRLGLNDGHNESFAYTEVDRTVSFGADLAGKRWRRKHDKIGAAFAMNGISGVHRQYLALGGMGFLLGDGRLNYGREKIVEAYYTAHLWRGVFTSLDLQHINNPGYNRARGPVLAAAGRMHVDF
jgi:hypothetical protein